MAALPVWLRRDQARKGFAPATKARSDSAPEAPEATEATEGASAPFIKAQQIDLLYQNSTAGIAAGSAMFLAAMAAMLYLGAVTPSLWVWAALNFSCFCVGFVQLRAYRQASAESKVQPVWGQRIVIGGIVAGALWGVLTFYLGGPLQGQEIPVVSGMVLLMVGAVSGYAVYRPAIFGFSAGIAGTSVLGLLTTQGPYHISLAVMMLAVFASVVQFGILSNRAYTKALVLDATNRQLIESLTKHQLQLEASNEARMQFFASASHDLRQPMHALGLFSEGLARFHRTRRRSARLPAHADFHRSDGRFDRSIAERCQYGRRNGGAQTRAFAHPVSVQHAARVARNPRTRQRIEAAIQSDARGGLC